MNQQINLKELSLDQCKAFAWDLQAVIQQYSTMLQTVTQEINARIQNEAIAKKEQQAQLVNKVPAQPQTEKGQE